MYDIIVNNLIIESREYLKEFDTPVIHLDRMETNNCKHSNGYVFR